MAYPSYDQSVESVRRAISDSAQAYIATDGSLFVRDYTSETTYEFTVIHEFLTPTQANTVLTEYDLHAATAFTWQGDYGTFSGQTYTCYFLGEPLVDPSVPGEFFRVVSRLIGTMD